MTVFGPGTLKIGETASSIDVSCLVNGLKIEATSDFGDPTWKLCGTQRPGSRKFTFDMTGNIDIDPEDPAGIFALSQSAYGTEVKFEFVPNTGKVTKATGTLVLTPLTFGADAFGDDMTSDIAWPLVGKPVYTYPTPPGGDPLTDDDTEIEPVEIGDAVPITA